MEKGAIRSDTLPIHHFTTLVAFVIHVPHLLILLVLLHSRIEIGTLCCTIGHDHFETL